MKASQKQILETIDILIDRMNDLALVGPFCSPIQFAAMGSILEKVRCLYKVEIISTDGRFPRRCMQGYHIHASTGHLTACGVEHVGDHLVDDSLQVDCPNCIGKE